MGRVAFWFFPGIGFSLLQSELFSTSICYVPNKISEHVYSVSNLGFVEVHVKG